MSEVIKKLLGYDKIRYLVAGGCTTLVNFIVFFTLRSFTDILRNTCNVIAILMAITFAYFANKLYVFQSRTGSVGKVIGEALSFAAARLVSMMIELLGFAILCDSFRINELLSKIMVQFVVIAVNYILSKLFVFKKERRTIREFVFDNYIYLLSFFITLVLMLAVCVALGVKPFGKYSLTLVDSLHQYLPFYGEYRDKLLNEGSMFYTWNLAMGSNFVSLFSYYLSSPFNYLFILVPKMEIPAMVTIIVSLKIALSAVCMAYFLAKKDGTTSKNLVIVPMALCYALSNYVIGYNWNFMWMDCIMIFPLIILGFKRLMEKEDPKLYVLSLAYCLYCNYYIGFIICVFLVLWFLAYRHKGIKKFILDGCFFAFYSVLSAGLVAFLLIPAYKGIMTTASAGTEMPKWSWYGSIFEILKQQFILTKPINSQVFDGGANLYCGTFIIFAFFVYIFASHIRFSEKFGKLALVALLLVSCNETRLNFIWHGFHNQYGIPNRFTFVYIFVLVVIAYDVLRRISKINIAYVLSGGFLAASFVLICNMKAEGGLDKLVLILTFVFIAVYAILCMLRSAGVLNRVVFMIIFTVICSGELIYNAAKGFSENGYAGLVYYSTTPEVTQANDRIEELAKEENAGFYRSELMKSTVLDEVTWHHMPSVGTFCSTVLGDMTSTMGRLGFYTGANEFLYMGATPFTNSIFNVRYLIERPGDLNNFAFEYVDNVESVNIFENKYPLSLGFAVNEDIKNWDRDANLPFAAQNTLAYAMTGMPVMFNAKHPELIVASETAETQASGDDVMVTPYASGNASFFASFFAEEDGDYYVNCRGNSVYKIRIYVNGNEIAYDRYQLQIFHIGELSKDDYVSIEYEYRSLGTGTTVAHIHVSTFDENAYNDIYSELNKNMLDVTELEDGYVKAELDMPEGKTLFTSIPYDEGWTVKVDGKKTDYYKSIGSFIGVDIEAGEHEIEFMYVPSGLRLGIVCSIVSLALFMLGIMNNSNKKTTAKLVKHNKNDVDLDEDI